MKADGRLKRAKQKAKERRIHRNCLRNPNSRVIRYLGGEVIKDRPNWKANNET